MTRILQLLSVALLTACLLVMPACQKKVEKPAEPETFKIGAIFAVTGPASFLGSPEKNTVEMIAEQINAAGGINGKKLEVVVIDSQTDATKAVLAANKLIKSENVLAIVGPSTSGESLAIVDIAEKEKVPLVSAAASRKITEPVKPWVYKTPQNDMLTVQKIYDHLNSTGKSKVAIISVSNAFGQSGREELLRMAEEYKIEIIADEVFAPKDTDMTAQLTKIKGTDAEAVICWGTNPGPAIVARNMKQLGMEQQLYMSHGVASKKFIELAGDAANGIILPAGRLIVADQLPDTDAQKKMLLKYKADYETKFNDSVSTFGGHAYDGLMLLIEALKAVGGDREKIRTYLENKTGFVGTGGIFNFSATDHNGLDKSAFVLIQIVDNDWQLMEAPAAAEAPAEDAAPAEAPAAEGEAAPATE